MSKELDEMTIGELVAHEAATRAHIVKAVIEARRGQSTWAAIGSSLGVSMQEAHRRYAHLCRWADAADGVATHND
jgi:hypothetical protein